jgi:hypothetical protein
LIKSYEGESEKQQNTTKLERCFFGDDRPHMSASFAFVANMIKHAKKATLAARERLNG